MPTEKEVKEFFSKIIHNFENEIEIYNSKDTNSPLKRLKNTWKMTYDMGTGKCKIKNNYSNNSSIIIGNLSFEELKEIISILNTAI